MFLAALEISRCGTIGDVIGLWPEAPDSGYYPEGITTSFTTVLVTQILNLPLPPLAGLLHS